MSASLEGGRLTLTRVAQRCWSRAEVGHPGLSIILQYSRGGSSSHGKFRARVRVVGIFLLGGIGRVSIRYLGYISGLRVSSCGQVYRVWLIEYLLIGLGFFYLRVRFQMVFGVEIFGFCENDIYKIERYGWIRSRNIQDLRTPATFINSSGLKRDDRWNFCQQDTAGRTSSTGFFRADHRTLQI